MGGNYTLCFLLNVGSSTIGVRHREMLLCSQLLSQWMPCSCESDGLDCCSFYCPSKFSFIFCRKVEVLMHHSITYISHCRLDWLIFEYQRMYWNLVLLFDRKVCQCACHSFLRACFIYSIVVVNWCIDSFNVDHWSNCHNFIPVLSGYSVSLLPSNIIYSYIWKRCIFRIFTGAELNDALKLWVKRNSELKCNGNG